MSLERASAVAFTVRIPRELHARMRHKVIDLRTTIQDVMLLLIENFVSAEPGTSTVPEFSAAELAAARLYVEALRSASPEGRRMLAQVLEATRK